MNEMSELLFSAFAECIFCLGGVRQPFVLSNSFLSVQLNYNYFHFSIYSFHFAECIFCFGGVRLPRIAFCLPK